MLQPAIYEPQLLYPEQFAAKKPWERADNEPARWFMRFSNYRLMGPKRSIHAVYEAEKQSKGSNSRGRAGETWYNAAKKYQWQARADAWDAEQDEKKAEQMREIAMACAFTSRPFRIAQLNSMADTLSRQLEQGHDPATFLALTKQIQSLMQDITKEIEAWGMHFDASCDAAALDVLKEKYKRMQDLEQERWDIMEEEMDRKLQYCKERGLI